MEVKVSQAEAVRNFYRKQGAEQEQARIIKLLEDNQTLGYGYLVALIKGENK